MLNSEMSATVIRTAPYMKLIAEQTNNHKRRYGTSLKKAEMYNKGDEWYAILYYDDGNEVANILDESFIPGGWLDADQAICKLIYCLTS